MSTEGAGGNVPGVTTGGRPDVYTLIARRLHGVSDAWRWYELRGCSGGTYVRGAVCTEIYKSGRFKGHANWRKRDRTTEREMIVTPEQIKEAVDAWERETGSCFDCGGTGLKSIGWDHKEGVLKGPCQRCKP